MIDRTILKSQYFNGLSKEQLDITAVLNKTAFLPGLKLVMHTLHISVTVCLCLIVQKYSPNCSNLSKMWRLLRKVQLLVWIQSFPSFNQGLYTRMLRSILNQLYGHLPPIMKTIQVRWTRHAGHCWRSKDELISDVLLWTPT